MSGTHDPKCLRVSECDNEVEHEGGGFTPKKKVKGEDNTKGKDHLTEHDEMTPRYMMRNSR